MATQHPLPAVVTVEETGSTQQDLLAAAVDEQRWPHLSGIRALRQTGGRGRAGRTWETDRLAALTVSLVLRPALPVQRWPWLPLLTGVAVVDALAAAGAPAALKWPNDVVLPARSEAPGWGRRRKVGGILAEVLPGGRGVVVGLGLNLDGEPPVAWATTLAAHGCRVPAEDLLDAVRARLSTLLVSDPDGWREVVAQRCVTIGARVRVQLPGGREAGGTAVGLDEVGALVVEDADGGRTAVTAGDVEHLRTAPEGR